MLVPLHPEAPRVGGGERGARGEAAGAPREPCRRTLSIANSTPRHEATGTSAAADCRAYESRRLDAARG